jgi:hypothetical protein
MGSGTYLWACCGVRRACSGSRLDPSPIDANDRFFWFRIDLIKPLTITLSVVEGAVSRRSATDRGAAALRVEV